MNKFKCFITINTDDLLSIIEALGKTISYTCCYQDSIGLLYDSEDDIVYGVPELFSDNLYENLKKFYKKAKSEGYIDCKENITLFLALISYNSKSEYNKWYYKNNIWLLSNKNNLSYIKDNNFIQATIQELIEHFLPKEKFEVYEKSTYIPAHIERNIIYKYKTNGCLTSGFKNVPVTIYEKDE